MTSLLGLGYVGCSVVNDPGELEPPLGSRPDCGGGEAFCNGSCIDVSADAGNCGGCGVTCPDGVACVDGGCDLTCETGVACGAGCVDTATDPANCGACGNACPAGTNQAATCTDGVCGVMCAAGFGDCNDDPSDGCETDVNTDPTHCGACGAGCVAPANAPAQCVAGACMFDGTCNGGFGDCDADAVNGCEERLPGSQNHCGACGNPCAANEYCKGDTCQPLVVAAADGRRFGAVNWNLYNIDLTTGQTSVITTFTRAQTGLGFVDGELYTIGVQGVVQHVELPGGALTQVATLPGVGFLGLAQLADGRVGTCRRRNPQQSYMVFDLTSGDFSVLSTNCGGSGSSLFGDRSSAWVIGGTGTSELFQLDAFGQASTPVSHSAGNNIRGATWHLGEIFAIRCDPGFGCSEAQDLIKVDPANGNVSVVATFPPNRILHALASPRPVN